MLVEVIITSTVIITSMVGLYAGFSKIYAGYQARDKYYHLDGVYAINETIEYLLDNNFNQLANDVFYQRNHEKIIENGACATDETIGSFKVEICPSIQSLYNIENMIFTEYDKSTLDTLVIENETFKEYINYVIEYYDIKEHDTAYSYLFLVEIKDGEDYYYSNLRMR